ncbi:MAG: transposase [Marinilabiliaceae bacterium]|nr:transposase [Marinilabiliaceae bacterium]MBI9061677.1 transposase [Marinilabiliaceae bacterium]
MSTYTQILYQIVFSTKDRGCTLSVDHREDLFRYIWGILKNKKCHLYRIGGVEDHLHIITHLHPEIAPALLVKDIKLSASDFIRKEKCFSGFDGWQDGYAAFTYSISAKDNLIEYVKNQEAHHRKFSFKEEYMKLLEEHEIEFEEKYLY